MYVEHVLGCEGAPSSPSPVRILGIRSVGSLMLRRGGQADIGAGYLPAKKTERGERGTERNKRFAKMKRRRRMKTVGRDIGRRERVLRWADGIE